MRSSKLSLITLALITFLTHAQNLWALQFHRYHSQQEINVYLRDVAQKFPELARYEVLGRSRQGREIGLLTLTKARNPEAPAIYLNATHHGNEKASTEALLALTHHLSEKQNEPAISRLLARYRFLIHPLVNPDGHALHTRGDANGIDPNRDYAGPQKPEKEAFQLPETRLVRDLLRRENVVASATYHSGLEAILWPWCHTPQSSQHDSVFRGVGELVARSMGVQRAKQSYYDYKTDGEFIDYAYMKHGIYALTLEVSTDATPPADQLTATVERAITGSLTFLQSIDQVLEKSDRVLAGGEAQAVLW
jgi:predicted deacylase